ncbi:hypothetical protein BCR39DRAFT_548649 [Naematelia encephala]|uniref:Zn(2)-C6 fungal-type domain-containing protein n=1 Tax=Naematelia encephala TaxID=71784 RepID=A0A1Y2AMT7_9TREE|nr:hypothetical protein BCR39DRAFT_548649 [Naematelia encephala]
MSVEFRGSPDRDQRGHSSKRSRASGESLARVACISCRKVKVRCQPPQTQAQTGSICERCVKLGLSCEWPESMRGRWRRKTSKTDDLNTAPPAMISSEYDRSQSAEQYNDLDPFSSFLHTPGSGDHLSQSMIANSSSSMIPHQPMGLPPQGQQETLGLPLQPPTSSVRLDLQIQSSAEEVRDFNGRLHFKIAHQIPPLGILAEASMELRDRLLSKQGPDARGDPVDQGPLGGYKLLGMANNGYFGQSLKKHLLPAPGPPKVPDIIAKGIITIEESRKLFEIYFEHCQPLVCLLDERVTTPSVCSSKSPFLFTAVCATASRYRQSDVLFRTLLAEAHREGMHAMFNAKSLCTVQGFLLLSWWNQPTASYEDDNTYLYAGIAFRLATEIGLHHKNRIIFPVGFNPTIQRQYELELLDRERTYRACFVHDRMIMWQGGKPDSVLEVLNIRTAREDYGDPLRTLVDVRMSANVERMQIITRSFYVIYGSVDSLSGIRSSIDFQRLIVRDLQYRMDNWHSKWMKVLEKYTKHKHYKSYTALFAMDKEMTKLGVIYICLARLLETDPSSLESITSVSTCYHSASEVLKTVREQLGPLGVLRYAPEYILIDVVYCATILMKLSRSDLGHIIQREEALERIYGVVLALEDSAEDEIHLPMLYAIFLRKQIADIQDRFAQSSSGTDQQEGTPNLNDDIDFGPSKAPENSAAVYASGDTTDPFHPEGLFDNLWLDTVLATQLNTIRPYVGNTESTFWELFGISDPATLESGV